MNLEQIVSVGRRTLLFAWGFSLAVCAAGQSPNTRDVPVSILGGHDTDVRDRGRPVSLVAGGLGVPPEVFREAFSHVRPAPGGMRPDLDQVMRNKEALLGALSRYGVTNDLLDRVSNTYRYNRSRGEMWPTTAASVVAVMNRGALTGFRILNPGAGYNSAPTLSVPGRPDITVVAVLSFGRDLARNGSIVAVRLIRH